MVVNRAPKPWQKTAKTRKSKFTETDCISELGIHEIEWLALDLQMKVVRNQVMKVPPYQGIFLMDMSKDQFTSLAEICFDEAAKQVKGVGYRLDNPVSQTPLSIIEEKKWLKDIISAFFGRQWNNANLERLELRANLERFGARARRKSSCHACGTESTECDGMGEVTSEL